MNAARCVAAGLLALLVAAAGAAPIEYVVTPAVGPAGLHALDVEVRLRGDEDGSTAFVLPQSWAGSERLHERIERLAVRGGTLDDGADPVLRTVRHAPRARLVLSYRIRPQGAEDPGPNYEKARPVLRPSWFYVHGEGGFVLPQGRDGVAARLRWGPVPKGWRMVSDLDVMEGATVADVSHAVLMGGTDLRILQRTVGGRPLRLALRGKWLFDDAALADTIARIVAAENGYFGSAALPYQVTLAPLTGADTGATSYGGTGRAGGFALAATANVGLDRFMSLLAHEYGHRWLGNTLGPVADPDAPEYWFTEGFGDFAAAQALLRAALWDEAAYARHLNFVLWRYAASPARTLPNDQLAERFWSDRDAMQMPYDRGHLFALSLDRGAAVNAALRRMAAGGDMFPAHETQAARFVRAARPAPDALQSMLGGQPIELPADLFAPCGALEWTERPVFASGYTVHESAQGRVFATVDEASPAWAAGLRPGMRYLRRESFDPDDSSVPLVMRVADAEGERVLRWLPQGQQKLRAQVLRLSPLADEAARRACNDRLAGVRKP